MIFLVVVGFFSKLEILCLTQVSICLLLIKVHMNCSKTDPFPVDCDIHVGHGDSMVCLVLILGNYH